MEDQIKETFQQLDPLNESLIGYSLASTCLYLSKDYSFPKAKRKYLYDDLAKINPKVDPVKYSDDLETSKKKYWLNSSGAFLKEKKTSYLDKAIKHGESIPGPGQYYDDTVNKRNRCSSLGKFEKSSKVNYLSQIEAISEEIPSSFKYNPYPKKKYSFTNSMYHVPYYKEDPEKKKLKHIGPGSYDADKSIRSQVLSKTIVYSPSKCKLGHNLSLNNLQNNHVPGVGTYTDIDINSSMLKLSLKKKPIINPYKFKRFTETVGSMNSWIPGPGTYNIGPLPKSHSSSSFQILPILKKKIEKKGKKPPNGKKDA